MLMSESTLFFVFGVISALFALAGIIPYVLDILNGNTKPQRAAFFILTIAALISFFAQLGQGAKFSLYVALAFVLCNTTVFILSLKHGIGGFNKVDKIGLLLAFFVLVVWYFTASAALAIVCIVMFNSVAKFLVAHKAFYRPNTELMFSWLTGIFAGLFSALAVGKLDIILLLAPIQIFTSSLVITLIIYLRRQQIKLNLTKEQYETYVP